MNAIRGLVAVIGALAVTRLLVQPLEIWMRLALVAVSTMGILAGAWCAPRSQPFPRVLGPNNNWRVLSDPAGDHS